MGYPHFKKPPQLPELFGVSVQAIPGLKTLKMLEASRLQHADSCPPFLWQSKVISLVLFERLQKRWFSKKKKKERWALISISSQHIFDRLKPLLASVHLRCSLLQSASTAWACCFQKFSSSTFLEQRWKQREHLHHYTWQQNHFKKLQNDSYSYDIYYI